MLRKALLTLTALALMPVANARGEVEVEAADRTVSAVSDQISKMEVELGALEAGARVDFVPEVGKVDRRLREGEIQFILKDYLRAAIVLLDVVDDESHAAHPKIDDAKFRLAESLRLSRNFAGAQRYYQDLLTRVSGDRLKDVVLGLLQISGATNRFENVEGYIARLRQAGTLSRPDVDYIYGKMLFKSGLSNPENMIRANDVFSKIPAGHSVSAWSAYYAGVSLVQLGRYEQAIEQFKATQALIGSRSDDQSLRELCQLSLGRLYQEVGEIEKSAVAYQEIEHDSEYFSDVLYEVAWAHVAEGRRAKSTDEVRAAYSRALQSIDLLMVTAPESRLYPEARILQGNLQIRLGAEQTAYDTFQTLVDEYGGARDKIARMIEGRTDAKQFFRDLLAADLDRIEAKAILPKLAVTWALEEDDMERAVAMERDLTDSQAFLQESRDLVDTLEASLISEQRFNMFPGLKDTRTQAIGIENRALDARRALLELEREIVRPYLAEAQRLAVDDANLQGASIGREIERLPQSDSQVDASRADIRDAYIAASREAHLLRPRLSTMRAQLVAAEIWVRDNPKRISTKERGLIEDRLEEARGETQALGEKLARLEQEILLAAEVVGQDAGRGRAKQLASQYDVIQDQQVDLLFAGRGQVPSKLQGALARIDQQRVALDGVESRLSAVQKNLDGQVKGKVDEIRYSIAKEVEKLGVYTREHNDLQGEMQGLLGPVADRTLAGVGKQFRDLVLKADVGIIDVAWARKQQETSKVNGLIREQQRRSQELEAEFAEFLRD